MEPYQIHVQAVRALPKCRAVFIRKPRFRLFGIERAHRNVGRSSGNYPETETLKTAAKIEDKSIIMLHDLVEVLLAAIKFVTAEYLTSIYFFPVVKVLENKCHRCCDMVCIFYRSRISYVEIFLAWMALAGL